MVLFFSFFNSLNEKLHFTKNPCSVVPGDVLYGCTEEVGDDKYVIILGELNASIKKISDSYRKTLGKYASDSVYFTISVLNGKIGLEPQIFMYVFKRMNK